MDVTEPLPWRRGRQQAQAGLPAWSMPTDRYRHERFPADLFERVDPEWAWSGADGGGIRACVLDSGVDGAHPLVAPIERAWHVVPGEGARPPDIRACPPEDAVGHGTACAGIIRAVAPAVSLSSIKVLNDGRSGSAVTLIAGLAFAIEQGFDVINLSLSTPRPEFRDRLAELCDHAYFRRTVLVVAAHNLPIRSFPWSFSSVVSVASHAEADPMRYYYNATPPVEFYAPGVRVAVAVPGGGTSRNTGNSFAAPHLAGIAALVLSKHPWLTPFQLKSVLYHCAANVSMQGAGDGTFANRVT
jgi:subtilisin